MSTIYDIAKKTGISVATVGRCLSGKGYVSNQKREMITNVAKQMNYIPNISAKTLRNNITQKILFFIPDLYNDFYFKMIKGANDVLEQAGYFIMLCHTKQAVENELAMLDFLSQRHADGLIFVSFDFNEKNTKKVRAINMPVVLTNKFDGIKEDDNFDYVFSDHIAGAKIGTEHLIENGCHNIGILIGDSAMQTSRERVEGYIAALTQNGIKPNKEFHFIGNYTKESAYNALKENLESVKKLDGLMIGNDLMGLGALELFKENGIKVPEDIKIVSFDNTEFASLSEIGLTSIDLQQDKIGRYAAEMLLERLVDGRTLSRHIIIEPKLIIRKSSGGKLLL